MLMMTHMAPKEVLVEECRKMESYGAQGVVLMDSAGARKSARGWQKNRERGAEQRV